MLLRLLFFSALIVLTIQAEADEKISIVAVSANFSPAFREIVDKFSTHTNYHIKTSVGSSGALVRQIEQGAPFELFISADEAYAGELYDKGLSDNTGRIYAVGKLVLFIPELSHINKTQDLDSIIKQIISDKTYRLAVANPDVAPYGQAAIQVLKRFTTIQMLKDRMVLGENVGQTAQFALTNSVDVAFLPYSLVISSQMNTSGHFEIIPDEWYKPINQRMVLLRNAAKPARELYKFMNSNEAKQIILKYGYSLPPA